MRPETSLKTKLSVNVNKVATLRNARGGERPDVVQAARVCLDAGCHGITVHPRPDGRHIRRRDVFDLAAGLGPAEFNIEGFPTPEYLDLVCEVKPTQATLVPDPPDVITSNAGWNLAETDSRWLGDILQRLRDNGVRTSLFLEPEPAMVERAKKIGADRIELYTERYAATHGTPDGEEVLERYRRAAANAVEIGLGLNAGHDLSLENLSHFARRMPGLLEVSIGHALICDALYMGLFAAVTAYLRALGHGEPVSR